MTDGRYVKSFDGQDYVIPLLPNCYTLLSKDCSSAKEFSVLAKKVQYPLEETDRGIAVQFNMRHPGPKGQQQFELYLGPKHSQHQHPEGQQQTNIVMQMNVLLNGKLLDKQEFTENGIDVINPPKSPPIYIITCPNTGSQVEFDGYQLHIFIDKRFVNKQCGVCGHYNLDKADDLMMVAGGEGAHGQQQRGGRQQVGLRTFQFSPHSSRGLRTFFL